MGAEGRMLSEQRKRKRSPVEPSALGELRPKRGKGEANLVLI